MEDSHVSQDPSERFDAAGISQLIEAYQSGETTSEAVVSRLIDRIEADANDQDALNVFISTPSRDALLEQARAQDARRAADGIEICDEVDNDCNDLLNDGIECVFYAHGPEGVDSPENSQGQFFTVDPFKKKVTYISEILNTDGSLLDIDTSPDGIIYGISAQSLYNYNRNLNAWVKVGDLQTSLQGANGLAIDRSGEAFATARAELYSVDLNSGRANKLGNLTGNVNSSGDCVVNKGDVLFMTSKQDDPNLPDDLIKIDRTNNTTEKIGTTSHSRIFGLTAAWGKLFGLTANGELIEIDQRTGASTLIEKFDGRVFYGAASTPER